MGAPELEVHSSDLSQAASMLTGAGSALFGHASDLETTPDAGASTDEVAKALVALSTAVAAMAEHLGQVADTTGANSTLFTTTDQFVASGFDTRTGLITP